LAPRAPGKDKIMKTIAKITVEFEPGPPVPIPPDPPDPGEPVPPLPPRPEPDEPDRASTLLRLAELPRLALDRAAAARKSVSVAGGIVRMRRPLPPTTS
jgi:hypothetical protein